MDFIVFDKVDTQCKYIRNFIFLLTELVLHKYKKRLERNELNAYTGMCMFNFTRRIVLVMHESSRTHNGLIPWINHKDSKLQGRNLNQAYDKSPYTHRKIRKSTGQHKNATETSITQRLCTDFGQSVGVTKATHLVWLNGLRDLNLSNNHKSCVIKRTHILKFKNTHDLHIKCDSFQTIYNCGMIRYSLNPTNDTTLSKYTMIHYSFNPTNDTTLSKYAMIRYSLNPTNDTMFSRFAHFAVCIQTLSPASKERTTELLAVS